MARKRPSEPQPTPETSGTGPSRPALQRRRTGEKEEVSVNVADPKAVEGQETEQNVTQEEKQGEQLDEDDDLSEADPQDEQDDPGVDIEAKDLESIENIPVSQDETFVQCDERYQTFLKDTRYTAEEKVKVEKMVRILMKDLREQADSLFEQGELTKELSRILSDDSLCEMLIKTILSELDPSFARFAVDLSEGKASDPSTYMSPPEDDSISSIIYVRVFFCEPDEKDHKFVDIDIEGGNIRLATDSEPRLKMARRIAIYVGSTIQSLAERASQHRNKATNQLVKELERLGFDNSFFVGMAFGNKRVTKSTVLIREALLAALLPWIYGRGARGHWARLGKAQPRLESGPLPLNAIHVLATPQRSSLETTTQAKLDLLFESEKGLLLYGTTHHPMHQKTAYSANMPRVKKHSGVGFSIYFGHPFCCWLKLQQGLQVSMTASRLTDDAPIEQRKILTPENLSRIQLHMAHYLLDSIERGVKPGPGATVAIPEAKRLVGQTPEELKARAQVYAWQQDFVERFKPKDKTPPRVVLVTIIPTRTVKRRRAGKEDVYYFLRFAFRKIGSLDYVAFDGPMKREIAPELSPIFSVSESPAYVLVQGGQALIKVRIEDQRFTLPPAYVMDDENARGFVAEYEARDEYYSSLL